MERQSIRINLDISTFDIRNQDTSGTPKIHFVKKSQKPRGIQVRQTYLSVAMLSLAIDMRSSELPALLFIPLILVKGVLAPLTEPAGVDAIGELSPLVPPALFLAAFSARRFCLEAETGILTVTEIDEYCNFLNDHDDQSEFQKNGHSQHTTVNNFK